MKYKIIDTCLSMNIIEELIGIINSLYWDQYQSYSEPLCSKIQCKSWNEMSKILIMFESFAKKKHNVNTPEANVQSKWFENSNEVFS